MSRERRWRNQEEAVEPAQWQGPVLRTFIVVPGQRRTWTAREKETYAIICALRKCSGHIGLQPVVV